MSETTKKPFFVPLWAGAIIGGLFLALYIHQAAANATANVARIVVIDTTRLVEAKAMAMQTKDKQAVVVSAEAFAGQMRIAIKGLTDQGYIVMNTAHMVGWPDAMDKTPEVAQTLGVDLKLADKAAEQRGARARDLLQQSQAAQPAPAR